MRTNLFAYSWFSGISYQTITAFINAVVRLKTMTEVKISRREKNIFHANTQTQLLFTKGNIFMRRLFALILVFTLWFGFAPTATAGDEVANLTPCGENPAYIQKAKNFRNTTGDPNSGRIRAERYAEALCGPEGYPHLIVDGRWSHMGDFFIPSVLFLYIAGWIGWAGRSYIIAVRDDKNTEMKEVVIDVPLAISKMLAASTWPLLAFGEFTSGKLIANESEVTVSPR